MLWKAARDSTTGRRRLLLASGVWGVPSFRLLGREGEQDFVSWGQDRLWRVEVELRRRLGLE